MDTTYRLTQTGAEVQESLNKVPVNEQNIESLQSDKVDKEQGKGLSEANFTNQEKSKLGALPTRAELTEEENLKADKATTYTKTEVDTKLGQKQNTIPDLQTIREGAAAGATAYQKPDSGIPQSAMDASVQSKLNAAGSADAAIAAEREAREAADQYLQTQINGKANSSDVTSGLALKADKETTYTKQQVDSLLTPKQTAQQVADAIAAALAPYTNTAGMNSAIATALAPYSTTAEVNLAISNAIATALTNYYTSAVINQMMSEKVNKVDGKQLSTEDFTTALKNKLDALPTAADLATQISTAISDALASYYTKSQTDSLLAQKQTAQQVADAIAAALTSYSTTSQMNTAISNALAAYYTKTQVDGMFGDTNGRVLFLERGLGKYDATRSITLQQTTAGKYVNVNGQEVSASGYGISAEVQLNAGDIMLVPSASAVPASVSLFARIVTRTYDKVINYTYTYRQDYPELPATATADYNPALIYTAQYDESGDTPVLTGWVMGGQTYTTLPATREVTESYYEPLMKQAVAAMPSTGYYVYLCPTSMTIVVSGYTATVNGGVALVVGLGIFKNVATNFIGAPGQAVIAQAFAQLLGEIQGIIENLKHMGSFKAIDIDCENMPKVCGYPLVVEGAGAPSIVPRFVGQRYHDTTNNKCYEAFAVTNSTANWVLLN
ncbi:MAG: hypothetical protein IKC19_00595 [Bacteroidales bacterium]|nr:hypothetical protein [Bacteroidales bacterium]